MKPNNDSIIVLLNKNLAAAIDLHARCKHAHWNCTGPNFIAVHKLFDSLAKSANDHADTIAEHIRYLGTEAYGTVSAASKSFLGPYTIGVADTVAHLTAILYSLESLHTNLSAAIPACLRAADQVTADVFIELARSLSNDIYLVRSHLR